MKKILLVVMVFTLIASGAAFAATGTVAAGEEVNDTTSGNIIAKLSSGVTLGFDTVATSYTIATKHNKGPKAYGSSAGDTKIYFNDLGASTALPTVDDSTNTYFAAGSGWSEM